MPISDPDLDPSGQFFTSVDDEQYEELSGLVGERIVYTAVWEESVATAIADSTAAPLTDAGTAADLDLYLAAGVFFELYGVVCYTGLDEPPLENAEEIEARLSALVQSEATLGEVAVDEEDGLVLVITQGNMPALYLQIGAWILEEWEELPNDLDS
jgi:hypothetical protein